MIFFWGGGDLVCHFMIQFLAPFQTSIKFHYRFTLNTKVKKSHPSDYELKALNI